MIFGNISGMLLVSIFTLNTYRLALKKLDLAYRHKELSNTKEQYETHQNYQRLNLWCKAVSRLL
jgi:hypothetical protein